jgi:hypothetical protein
MELVCQVNATSVPDVTVVKVQIVDVNKSKTDSSQTVLFQGMHLFIIDWRDDHSTYIQISPK